MHKLEIQRLPKGFDVQSFTRLAKTELHVKAVDIVEQSPGEVVVTFSSADDLDEAAMKLNGFKTQSHVICAKKAAAAVEDEAKAVEEKMDVDKNDGDKNDGDKNDGDKNDDEPMSDEAKEIMAQVADRPGFCSENFKIELQNLPNYANISMVKKLLTATLKLNPHKLKPAGRNARYMFVNFSSEDERVEAICKLNGLNFRGCVLRAFKARPAKDPMLAKRDPNRFDGKSADEIIREATSPLSHLPYEEQVEQKTKKFEELIADIRRKFLKANDYLERHGVTEDALAKIDKFIPSPIHDGYRNKCEFSLGPHPTTQEVTVGFRAGCYREGSLCVVNVGHLPIVSDEMKAVVAKFETFVRNEKEFVVYDFISQKGHWRQLTLKQGSSPGDMMAVVVVHPQDLPAEKLDQMRSSVKAHFVDENTTVSSLFIQLIGQREKGVKEPEPELIFGRPSIQIAVSGLRFDVSPTAFFQSNTSASEKLYEAIIDMAGLDKDTIALDVCCGTGAIGLCLANKVKHVYGVEVVEEAVRNAEANAAANEVDNVTFRTGRAEVVLPELLKFNHDEKIVAILDPPRAGVGGNVVQAMRASSIERFVYVSCDARRATTNFLAFGKCPSKAYKNDPFLPTKAFAVDLFPHTHHTEVVLLFERFSTSGDKADSAADKADSAADKADSAADKADSAADKVDSADADAE